MKWLWDMTTANEMRKLHLIARIRWIGYVDPNISPAENCHHPWGTSHWDGDGYSFPQLSLVSNPGCFNCVDSLEASKCSDKAEISGAWANFLQHENCWKTRLRNSTGTTSQRRQLTVQSPALTKFNFPRMLTVSGLLKFQLLRFVLCQFN